MNLPLVFFVREWINGHAIFLHGRMIALVTPLPNGSAGKPHA
ncbi:hypothetical protein [Stenotrophomonas sp.]|nr:hypothetical protein [Stenotrophomonas sp.]